MTLVDTVAGHVHAGQKPEAAKAIVDFCEIAITIDPDKPDKYMPVLTYFVHDLMENGQMAAASKIFWPPTKFSAEPQSVKELWGFFDKTNRGLIMGASSMGKSYGLGVRLMLEWVRDPRYTSASIIGPSEKHLERNLFSHLVDLHRSSALPLPGEVGDLFIGLDRRDQGSAIVGVVIPKSETKKAGRLQGAHRRPRAKPHPIFGPLARMFFFLDEIENIPGGIWHDLVNVMSGIDSTPQGIAGLKIFGSYNPTDQGNEVANQAEPPFGWGNLNPDEHFGWKSKRGWDVLRLDGERCENVIHKRTIYPGLQTVEGLEAIAASGGGRQSAKYLTMGRGVYPKQGMEVVVVPPGMLEQWRAEYVWLDAPHPVGSVDLALDGGDEAVYTLGEWGMATGIQYPPNLAHPMGRRVMFKDSRGKLMPRWALLATKQFVFPKGDTVEMARMVIDLNKKAGVRPEFFACDATGHGRGVADLMKNDWSSLIHAVNYSSGSSDMRVMVEDTDTCKVLYERMFTELWMAMRLWGEFTYFALSPKLEMSKLTQQITQRRIYTIPGGKSRVESKKDYESRGFSSPNDADSLTLLVHAARKGSGVVLSMRGDSVIDAPVDMEDWPTEGGGEGVRVDPSSRSDFLDERQPRWNDSVEIL